MLLALRAGGQTKESQTDANHSGKHPWHWAQVLRDPSILRKQRTRTPHSALSFQPTPEKLTQKEELPITSWPHYSGTLVSSTRWWVQSKQAAHLLSPKSKVTFEGTTPNISHYSF